MANGYNTFLTLGGVELTIHGRKFQESREERSTEVVLANGHIRKYVKYIAKGWELEWTWLPNDATTVDACGGRDAIKALCANGEEKTFVVTNANGSTSSYTVFVLEYNETLLRRDVTNQKSYWDISLALKEV